MPDRVTLPGLEVAWATHTGRVRQHNEDAIGVVPLLKDGGVFVAISDGMGGQAGGEVASKIARDRLLQSVEALSPECSLRQQYAVLRDALLDADRLVRASAAADLSLTGMGATALAAAVTPSRAVHLYTGDSRLYHFRGKNRLFRTQDHSVVEVLHQLGQLEESAMQSHPQRNLLLSYVGGGGRQGGCDLSPKWKEDATRQEFELELEPGDALLLCTDGLHGLVPESTLADAVSQLADRSVSDIVTLLTETALSAGGTDNVTLAVVRVRESRDA